MVADPSAEQLSVHRGQLVPDSAYVFETRHGGGLKVTGQRSTVSTQLFKHKEFNFEKLGIGGLDDQFEQIFRRAFASRVFPPSVVERLGIRHVRGVLLFGPPGTGKTLIARQIGKMLNGKEPKVVNGPEVLNKYVGASEENIRNLFKEAEADYQKLGDASGASLPAHGAVACPWGLQSNHAFDFSQCLGACARAACCLDAAAFKAAIPPRRAHLAWRSRGASWAPGWPGLPTTPHRPPAPFPTAGADLHVIIFDEIDAICKSRGSVRDGSGVHDTIVNQLLTKIDGVDALNNILLIGMTNRCASTLQPVAAKDASGWLAPPGSGRSTNSSATCSAAWAASATQ